MGIRTNAAIASACLVVGVACSGTGDGGVDGGPSTESIDSGSGTSSDAGDTNASQADGGVDGSTSSDAANDACDTTLPVFSDGTFADADWNIQFVIRGNKIGGGGSSVQEPAGGNTGAMRHITIALAVDPTDQPGVSYGHHTKKVPAFDLTATKGITSIDITVDALSPPTPIGPGALMLFATVLQDNLTYLHSLGQIPNDGKWATYTKSIVASDFGSDVASSLHPDFSATGKPLSFGFSLGYSNKQGGRDGRIDNWKVTIHPVAPCAK